MRKTWFLLIMAALITPSIIQLNTASADLGKSAAPVASEPGPWQSTVLGLPDYDVRRELQELQELSALRSSDENPALKARVESIESFRANLSPEHRDNLRYEINEAGVPKMLFSSAGPLSKPSTGSADRIARGFLSANTGMFGLTRREVRRLKLDNEDPDEGTTFLSYMQTIDGLSLFQGQVQVAVNSNGEVLSVMEGMVIPNGKVNTTPAMTEEAALAAAFGYAGREAPDAFELTEARAARGNRATYRNPLGENFDDILSDLRIMCVGDRGVLAWHSYVDVGPSEWYEICVDANTGALLYRYNLYAHAAQGTVYIQHPTAGARTLQSFVGDTIINTAAGWMGTSTVTTGNNVEAYLDTDANNVADANNTTGLSNGHALAVNQDFTFPFVTGVDPRTQRPAVVTNLFYFCNLAHDFHYRLGFTETSRNFQTNNFGRGGVGNDSVRAEAQDGSGTNNANFATPTEGQRPRMQQYLFTQGTTSLADDRDSSQDGDVVMHEYGHGVSNRLVGGGSSGCVSGTQAGAMGEGWSDYWAITFYNDGRVGEYATGNTTSGIRRAAYTVPANTVHDSYADVGVGGFQVHRDGEVWAATLWDLRTSLGAAITDRLVLEGMKFTPCGPSFLNARDGILQADQAVNGGANRCAIWTVFARHGMGASASGNNGTTHNAASDVPADCSGGGGTVVFLDTFETSLGWVTNPSGTDTATTGAWERGDPQDTNSSGIKQLGTTVSGLNDLSTGRLAGAAAGDFDLDGGLTSVRSPSITLPSSGSLTLSFSFYLAHGSNSSSADFLRVRVVSGATNTTVFQRLGAAVNVNGAWASTIVNLNAFAGQTITIFIEAADASTASLVEAGIDDVRITSQ